MFIWSHFSITLRVIWLMQFRLNPKNRQGIFSRSALVTILLLTNVFVWYSYAIVILQQNIDALNLEFLQNILMWGIHFAALIFSAIFGVFLRKKLGGRIRFLAIWILFGILASAAPLLFSTTEIWGPATIGLVFGLSLGFGMPNCMGYFNSQVPTENRGKIGGCIFLLSGVLTVAIDLMGINGLVPLTITLVVLRALALVPLALIKPATETQENQREPTFRAVISQRPFILYLVPWIMFALLNYLTTPVQQNVLNPELIYDIQLIGNVFLGAFALLGGFFMDMVGRKRLAIIGFIMLGLSYSILGVIQNPVIWYFHAVMNGISWGILYVLFVVTIWGDLSYGAPSDKYYALGVSPFFISKFLQLTINAQIVETIDITSIFSFTALFLFLAILPLIYAPETLPEKAIKERELKSYLEKAQRIVKKEEEKNKKQNSRKNEEQEEQPKEPKESPEDEEARKLAEKYY